MAATAPLLHISIAEVGPEQLVHRADGWACGCGGVDAVLLETVYIVEIVRATREPAAVDAELGSVIDYGASPRASIALAAGARAHAFLDQRGFALPEDVKAIAPDVLRHRVLPSYEAEADGLDADAIIEKLLDKVEMP